MRSGVAFLYSFETARAQPGSSGPRRAAGADLRTRGRHASGAWVARQSTANIHTLDAATTTGRQRLGRQLAANHPALDLARCGAEVRRRLDVGQDHVVAERLVRLRRNLAVRRAALLLGGVVGHFGP